MPDSHEISLQQELSKGSDHAFKQIFETYFKMLVVFGKKYVDDLAVAEDLVQEVFVKLYENKKTIQFHTSLKSFLFQSVKNKCIDHLRAQKTRSEHHERILISNSDDAVSLDDSMVQMELEERVYRAISELPDQCQHIFKQSRFEGKKNQEIADELGISKRTVETQISNALKRLRKDVFEYLKVLIIISLSNFF